MIENPVHINYTTQGHPHITANPLQEGKSPFSAFHTCSRWVISITIDSLPSPRACVHTFLSGPPKIDQRTLAKRNFFFASSLHVHSALNKIILFCISRTLRVSLTEHTAAPYFPDPLFIEVYLYPLYLYPLYLYHCDGLLC